MSRRTRTLLPWVVALALVTAAGSFAPRPSGAGGALRDGMPSSLAATNFTDVSVLRIPEPIATQMGTDLRVVAVGTDGANVKVAVRTQGATAWTDLTQVTVPYPTDGSPRVAQYWDAGCPGILVLAGNGAVLLHSGCTNPASITPYVPTSGTVPTRLLAAASTPYANLAGTGYTVAVDYDGATSRFLHFVTDQFGSRWEPFGTNCSIAGRLGAISAGAYEPVSDTVRLLAVGTGGIAMEFVGTDPDGPCTTTTIGTGQTLNDVSFVAPTRMAVAVGDAGAKFVRTAPGNPWTAVTPTGAFADYGLGVSPNLTGIAGFATGPYGASAVLVGKRVTPASAGPMFTLTDVRYSAAIDFTSSNVVTDLNAVDGLDLSHWWAVGGAGTIVHAHPGSSDGTAWFAPDTTGAGVSGYYLKLNCAFVTGDCNDPASNYGVGIEPPSGLQPTAALVGHAWSGLVEGTLAQGGERAALQSVHPVLGVTGGASVRGLGYDIANNAADIDVAGDSLVVGGYYDVAVGAYVGRRTIETTGIGAGRLAAGGASDEVDVMDYSDTGILRTAGTRVGSTAFLHTVAPQYGDGSLSVRTATVGGDLLGELTAGTNVPVSNPNCSYPDTLPDGGDYTAYGYGSSLYVAGGTCGGSPTDDLLRMTVDGSGAPGSPTVHSLPAPMVRPELSVGSRAGSAVMVVYDRGANQLSAAPVDGSGAVGAFVAQGVGLPLPSRPRAIGAVGGYVLALYGPQDEVGSVFTGRSAFAAPIQPDAPAAEQLGAWSPVEDIAPLPFLPTRTQGSDPFPLTVAGWVAADGRTVAYVGPFLDVTGNWSVLRYDLEGLSAPPGALSFNLAEQIRPTDGSLELPPSSCLPWGSVDGGTGEAFPYLSKLGTATLTLGGCEIKPDELWGWARLMHLKWAGERRSPPETDWGWVSLRGPSLALADPDYPSNAELQNEFACFDCDADSGSCAFCQSEVDPPTEAGARATCSACTGCSATAGVWSCGASGGSCAACYRYGVGLDRQTGDFHGFAWSGGTDAAGNDVGVGWISFGQGQLDARRALSFIQAQYGSIYSGGNIASQRGAPPFAEFGLCNAYLIQAVGTVSNLCAGRSDATGPTTGLENKNANPQANVNASDFNPGVVIGGTRIPFPTAGNRYSTTIGALDVDGLSEKLSGRTVNRYGQTVVTVGGDGTGGAYDWTEQQFLEAFDGAGASLDGRVFVVTPFQDGTFDITTDLTFTDAPAGGNGSGLIVVRGRVSVAGASTVEYGASTTLTRVRQLASAGWVIVPPNNGTARLTVDAGVTAFAGAVYVDGSLIVLTSGLADEQMVFHGPAMARAFDLQRAVVGAPGLDTVGGEVFVDDGRTRLNPPPGLTDIVATLPVYR